MSMLSYMGKLECLSTDMSIMLLFMLMEQVVRLDHGLVQPHALFYSIFSYVLSAPSVLNNHVLYKGILHLHSPLDFCFFAFMPKIAIHVTTSMKVTAKIFPKNLGF